MSDPPRIERHEAADRFGAATLRAAAGLGEALAGPGGDPEPVVVRTGGPHRSLDGLAALIDAALADDEGTGTAGDEHRAGPRTGGPDGNEAAGPRNP